MMVDESQPQKYTKTSGISQRFTEHQRSALKVYSKDDGSFTFLRLKVDETHEKEIPPSADVVSC